MGKRVAALALALGIAVAGGVPAAGAASVEVIAHGEDRVVIFSGPVTRADVPRMAVVLDSGLRIREVRFDSRGGNLEAGIAIGEQIRARRVATRVTRGSVCASACVYAFLGGLVRMVDADGRIGIHMASGAFNDDYVEAVKDVLRDSHGGGGGGGVDAKVRTIILLSEQFSAIAARRQARFLVEMGVSLRLLDPGFDTPHFEIHWLTPFELRDYNVVN